MSELLPCAWCRSYATGGSIRVWCGNDLCPLFYLAMTSEQWNRRAPAPAPVVGVTDGWISVKDELPEDNVPVLWCRAPVCEPYVVESMCGDDWSDSFTHWRPLPPPPGRDGAQT